MKATLKQISARKLKANARIALMSLKTTAIGILLNNDFRDFVVKNQDDTNKVNKIALSPSQLLDAKNKDVQVLFIRRSINTLLNTYELSSCVHPDRLIDPSLKLLAIDTLEGICNYTGWGYEELLAQRSEIDSSALTLPQKMTRALASPKEGSAAAIDLGTFDTFIKPAMTIFRKIYDEAKNTGPLVQEQMDKLLAEDDYNVVDGNVMVAKKDMAEYRTLTATIHLKEKYRFTQEQCDLCIDENGTYTIPTGVVELYQKLTDVEDSISPSEYRKGVAEIFAKLTQETPEV